MYVIINCCAYNIQDCTRGNVKSEDVNPSGGGWLFYRCTLALYEEELLSHLDLVFYSMVSISTSQCFWTAKRGL